MTQSTSWPNILATLIAKQDLSRDEADWAMSQIMDGDSSEAEIGAFMMANYFLNYSRINTCNGCI
jgi:anthranilate phosphoribosyltransferase